MGNDNYKYDEQEQGIAGEYENQHWLDNWLRLKVQQEQKEFNNLTREEAKKNVRSLTFIQLGLKGKVVIENFPDLTQLNLSNNEFEEIIVRNCPDLKLVSLGHNKLTKLKIENCPSVKELYTSFNQLTSLEEVKIEDLNNLRILSYDQNPLTTEEKDRLDALGLKDTAAKARVNGPAQEWLDAKYPLEERSKIEKLDISGLGLQGNLDLEDFTNLKSLDCSCNELTNLFLDDCKELEYLECSNNYYTKEDRISKGGIAFLNLSKNKKLKEVYVNHCGLEVININNLSELHTLNLTSNKIGLLDLIGLTNLTHLNVALNELDELDLSDTLNLKNLLCYQNKIEELKLKDLTNLEYLYCYHNKLSELDCSNLENLEEIYCAKNVTKFFYLDNLFIYAHLKKVNVEGCAKLTVLDCAENPGITELNLSNLPCLDFVSCKESGLNNLKINNCPSLEFLDFSAQILLTLKNKYFVFPNLSVDKNSLNNLKELYYSKGVKNVPWQTMPKLEVVGIGEIKLVKNKKKGEDEECYCVDEIDVLAQRNTSRVIKILANPNGYSSEDIRKLIEIDKNLKGVAKELKEKLFKLSIIKYNEEIMKKLFGEGYKDKTTPSSDSPEDSGGEENANSIPSTPPNETPTPTRTPTPQQTPVPKNNKDEDKDQLINDLKEKIAKLQAEVDRLKSESEKLTTSQQTKKEKEVEKEIEEAKEKINKSGLSDEQKQELLKQLEELANKNRTIGYNEVESPSSSHNYNLVWIPVLIGQAILLSALIYAYWCDWRKKRSL